jgi:hypothetical protein
VHHSDRSTQYLSMRYTDRLADAGIAPSVGSQGDAFDNAPPMSHTKIWPWINSSGDFGR